AMVAPLGIARGTQNKILEAMAAGVPVITSSIAAGGVDAIAGTDLLVADSPADIAEAAIVLMSDPSKRDRLAKSGRARMLSHHAWDKSMQRLDRIIERCMSGGACGREETCKADSRRSALRFGIQEARVAVVEREPE
ncbi:MAG TPA: glycosyltransferase, partial [Candidatus Binatus sp.]|nr:glycosyltransferase [Candidatus Binatus sp.]